jgi:UDP-N-acetylglucosamine transferase subunit ALG13
VIFVTVGSMLPFDRLIRATDAWAGTANDEVFAQTGNGKYEPRHMPFSRMLTPREFDAKVRAASLIIAHAGMGTVISALEAGKSIVLMPRRACEREVTTDHQIHTARQLSMKTGIFVAETENDLSSAIGAALASLDSVSIKLDDRAPHALIARIRAFLSD